MLEILVHITTTVISGCIIALFTHWLRNRKDKQATIATPTKIPSLFAVVRGFLYPCWIPC
ncbi:type I toxin-antitoxin system Fst family toxin [Streptococcus pneumoniae]